METKPANRSQIAKSGAKAKKAGPKKATKGAKEGSSSQEIPAGANVHLLARALWTAWAPEHAKLSAEQKKDAWKKDQKEYRLLARKVVNIIKRRMSNANPGAEKKGAGEPESMKEGVPRVELHESAELDSHRTPQDRLDKHPEDGR